MEKIKILQTILLIGCFTTVTFSQELEFHGSYSLGTIDKYKHNIGFGIGYNQYFNNWNRLGIQINYAISPFKYDLNYISTADLSKWYKEINARNQKMDIKFVYGFRVLSKSKSELFVGPTFSLSYLFVNQIVNYTAITQWGDTITDNYQSRFSENNRPNLGIIIEYQLKEILGKMFSVFCSLNPEIMVYNNPLLKKGYSQPAIILWVSFNVGIKYTFPKR